MDMSTKRPLNSMKDLMAGANSKLTDLEIGSKTKFIHQKSNMIQFAYLQINLLGILCCVLWYDSYHVNEDNFVNEYLLYGSLACSIVLIPMSLTHKCVLVQYFKYRAIYQTEDTIWSTGLVYEALKEILISFIMPYSYLKSSQGSSRFDS